MFQYDSHTFQDVNTVTLRIVFKHFLCLYLFFHTLCQESAICQVTVFVIAF